uniref:Clathrin interactor 1 n=1 Tax=Oncorhynchus kisutch TaxID=8019 RepID=A0A8C7JUD3_ONCKI
MNYSEVESKVREATNDDPWGPSGQQMADISRCTFMYEQFPEAMNMLWIRMLRENKKNWRRVYKSLLLLSHLIRNGSERVVTSSREHIYDLRSLESYHFVGKYSALSLSAVSLSLWLPSRSLSGCRLGSSRGKWDEDWKRDQGQFPFSDKLGEISDKIGSTIDDTINKFKKQSRDDSPDRFSDNEEERGRPSQNGQSGRSVFKDEEETVTTKSVQIVQATETTATKKRGGVPSKTVSLGAAAHYTGDKSPDTSAKQVCAHVSMCIQSMLVHSSLLLPSGVNSGQCSLAPSVSTHISPLLLFVPDSVRTSSGNGDFGDWNAFPGGQAPVPTPFAQPLAPSNTDLFGALLASSAPAPASADLFDLMGPGQTQSLSASQSLTFNMTNTQTISSTMPQSRSLLMGGPQQHEVMLGTEGSMGSAIPSTWSDSSVNISLDFLAPGMQPPKPVQPTLNTLQGEPSIHSVVEHPRSPGCGTFFLLSGWAQDHSVVEPPRSPGCGTFFLLSGWAQDHSVVEPPRSPGCGTFFLLSGWAQDHSVVEPPRSPGCGTFFLLSGWAQDHSVVEPPRSPGCGTFFLLSGWAQDH